MEDKLKFEKEEVGPESYEQVISESHQEINTESHQEVISESHTVDPENEDEIAYVTKRETLLNSILEKMIGKLNDSDSI